MASKVNTKFLLTLSVAVATVVGALVVLCVLNVRNSVERNKRRGDEALAEGNLQGAKDFYGRVVDKEPGNLEYLEKVRAIVLQQRPQTPLEASTFYREYISALRQIAQRSQNNAEAYEALMRELYASTRQFPFAESLKLMGKAADEMWSGLAADNPRRPLAQSYRLG